METTTKKQALQNFADNFGLEVNDYLSNDRRKKQKYFLTKNGTSISPKLDYNGINHFLLGMLAAEKNKPEYIDFEKELLKCKK